jgi:hypothetical protein
MLDFLADDIVYDLLLFVQHNFFRLILSCWMFSTNHCQRFLRYV